MGQEMKAHAHELTINTANKKIYFKIKGNRKAVIINNICCLRACDIPCQNVQHDITGKCNYVTILYEFV